MQLISDAKLISLQTTVVSEAGIIRLVAVLCNTGLVLKKHADGLAEAIWPLYVDLKYLFRKKCLRGRIQCGW
jgi:hypothetical protein